MSRQRRRCNGTATGGAKTTERTPLLSSISVASESLVMNKSVTGEIPTGVSWGVASFLLVNTALGAGMLNYPYAYNQIGGIFAAAAMQLILLVFITSTMFILVYCADFNRDDTYHDVLLSMCGKRAQELSALSILLTCYGINITFLVIIGDQYDRIFASLLPELFDESWYLDRKFTIFITSILFIWPMCYAKRLDFLKHASILGLFAMLYVAFLTVYEHYMLDEATIAAVLSRHLAATIQLEQQHQHSHNISHVAANLTTAQQASNLSVVSSQVPLLSNQTSAAATTTTLASQMKKSLQWFDPLTVVPILCFAYQTHEVVVPVYACMKERFVCSFMKASVCCLLILFFLYNIVGAYGYLTFGEHVAADIMSLYDAQDPIVVVGIVALVIKFVTTYPPLMFCGRTALDGLYGELRKLSTEEFKSGEKFRRYVISTLWFFSTVALAIFAPDISVTLQLLGSMASINVFVFPGLCLVALTRRLRRARLALLMGELPDGQTHQQRAKDYYLISGSYFGAMKKNAALKREYNRQQQQHHHHHGANNQQMNLTNNYHHHNQLLASVNECSSLSSSSGCGGGECVLNGVNNHNYNPRSSSISSRPQQHFTATFASLIEFDNNVALDTRSTGNNGINGGDGDFDYDDDDEFDLPLPHHMSDIQASSSNGVGGGGGGHHLYQSGGSCLQSSWKNKSTTGSLLERFGTSIAPSTVAQIGISRLAAFGLYLFAAMLILFGAFIFTLELVSVFGFL